MMQHQTQGILLYQNIYLNMMQHQTQGVLVYQNISMNMMQHQTQARCSGIIKYLSEYDAVPKLKQST